MTGVDNTMDTVIEYLESMNDMADKLMDDKLMDNSQQLLEDLEIITDWMNDLLDLRVRDFRSWDSVFFRDIVYYI